MDEIEKLLNEDAEKGIKTLTAGAKDAGVIAKYIAEYEKLDRTLRPSQVGQIQKDKPVGKGERAKTVKAIRTKVNFQRKIVTTAVAFEVGEPISFSSGNDSDLENEVVRMWAVNRMDDKVIKAKIAQKSQTEAALQFYVVKDADNKNQIKVKLLTNEVGTMAPYFDIDGDMKAFTWRFQSKTGDKTVHNVWIWSATHVFKFSDTSGKMSIDDDPIPHGFDVIPIVYVSQDNPEWYDVQSLIDRYETALSKLGASNDYSGYPLLKTYGLVKSLPDRDDDGKTLNFPMKQTDPNTGKVVHGDAEFLTNSNAPESVKLEMEKLENLIHWISSTPNLSFDNIKGSLGNLSGIAIKMLFLDSIIKAKNNEGSNRTMVDRILNVFASGAVTSVKPAWKTQRGDFKINIQFNSILPSDTKEAIDIVSQAVNSKVMSQKTAVEYLAFTDDPVEELNNILSAQTPAE